MSKVKKAPRDDSGFTGKGRKKVSWRGYVNYPVDEAMKVAYRDAVVRGWDWREAVEDVVSAGYKLSVSWDGYNQAFVGALYATNANDPNAGWCLSMRAANCNEACSRVLWVHVFALRGDWDVDGEARGVREW